MKKQLDIDRLIKCLALLSSPFEGERLAAAGRVNELLEASGLRWEEVFRTVFAEGHRQGQLAAARRSSFTVYSYRASGGWNTATTGTFR